MKLKNYTLKVKLNKMKYKLLKRTRIKKNVIHTEDLASTTTELIIDENNEILVVFTYNSLSATKFSSIKPIRKYKDKFHYMHQTMVRASTLLQGLTEVGLIEKQELKTD